MKKVADFPSDVRGSRLMLDWGKLFDGSVYNLVEGDDFPKGKAKSAQSSIRIKANQLGHGVMIRMDEKGANIYVQKTELRPRKKKVGGKSATAKKK